MSQQIRAAWPQPSPATSFIHPKRVSSKQSVCFPRVARHSARSGCGSIGSKSVLSEASIIPAVSEDTRFPGDTNNAQIWFDDTNQNVYGGGNVTIFSGKVTSLLFKMAVLTNEDDPPFYLRHKSSTSEDSTPLNRPSKIVNRPGASQVPTQSIQHCNAIESSVADFRDVIDDLTVENRRLKRKLKRLEQRCTPSTQSDPIFELRVHGLPPAKKRKLERTLQDFACDEIDAKGWGSPMQGAGQNLSHPPQDAFDISKPLSSPASGSRPVDSAYASMSTSGMASAHASRYVDVGGSHHGRQNKDRTVESYLQNMSCGLLPKHSPVLSDKARKQLVVRRLEQIFTGKSDNSSKHSQSQQQQEVSQSAANADRREIEAQGHQVRAEGDREARMLLNNDVQPGLLCRGFSPNAVEESSFRDTIGRNDATPDQRPTRQLDLDPSRAQNATENIQYIKHLGFGSPQLDSETYSGKAGGWVYLNLLINMAQLHTINVTPDFVRAAVKELSAKFELSADERSLRWKGGNHGTRLPGESDGSTEDSNGYSPDEVDASRAGRNGKTVASSVEATLQDGGAYLPRISSRSSGQVSTRQYPTLESGSLESQAFYKPLFHHGTSFEEDQSSLESYPPTSRSALKDDWNGEESRVNRLSCGPTMLETSRNVKSSGSMVFYKTARFCTDLTGDAILPAMLRSEERKCSEATLGLPIRSQEQMSGTTRLQSQHCGNIFTVQDINTDHSVWKLDWLEPSMTKSSLDTVPLPLEVSGLGGVRPEDNFTLEVSTRRLFLPPQDPRIEHVSLKGRSHLPATLPSPSYAFVPYSSSDDISDDFIEASENNGSGPGGTSDESVHSVPRSMFKPVSTESVDASTYCVLEKSTLDLSAQGRRCPSELLIEKDAEIQLAMVEGTVDQEPSASSVVATTGGPSMTGDGTSCGEESRNLTSKSCSNRQGFAVALGLAGTAVST